MIKSISLTVGLCLGLALAQSDKPEPVKVTTKQCGAYTVKLSENGFGDPEDNVSLLKGGQNLLTLADSAVSLDHCGDLTGDGVSELILNQFSGGAHCCTTVSVYSLGSTPKRILYAPVAHSGGVSLRQLDGRGPQELVTGDWRFAYAYDLSFADSPALPQVFAFRNGQYVQATREFPRYVLEEAVPSDEVLERSGDYLYQYAIRILAGEAAEAERYLKGIPKIEREWLENYAPEIRQILRSAGTEDWPWRAGIKPERALSGIAGSFSRPGTFEHLTTVHDGKTVSVRLFREQQGQIVSSPALWQWPLKPGEYEEDLQRWPLFTVSRAGGRDDAVLYSRGDQEDRYFAARVTAQELTSLTNDALGLATRLLSDLSLTASLGAAQYKKEAKSQLQSIKTRWQSAQERARPWLKTLNKPLNLKTLGSFAPSSIEVSRESESSALVAGTLNLGFLKPDQDSEYVESTRQTFAIFLEKRGGVWQVLKWQLTPRLGAGPMDRN